MGRDRTIRRLDGKEIKHIAADGHREDQVFARQTKIIVILSVLIFGLDFMLIVFTTTPSTEEAELLAQKIVDARLAACVQILPQITSVFVWEGKLQKEGEHLLLIKTLPEKWDDLCAFITAHHRYDVPEIVAVDAERVSAPYQAWLTDVLN